jgi:hypothetical protein
VIHKPRSFFKSSAPKFHQKGAVVILMAFIIGLGTATYLLKAFNVSNLQAEQDKKTYQSLKDAKQALIAWSVSHEYTPGQMPWPDRNGDGNYDGSSDCVTTPFQYSYLLGQLPSIPDTSPCLDHNTGLNVYAGLSTYPSLGQDFHDAQGNRLWYAVSRNLVRDYAASTNPIINPDIINAPTYPWLQVLDRNGNLVSNRVAAVILAPGGALDGQSRAGAANVSQFLDSFQIGVAVFNNRGYATPDEDFIMGDDGRNVSINDPTFVQPYNFNDKLIYITIDELMAMLEKRVGEQVRSSLKTYQDTNGYYPYAAHLGTSLSYVGDGNLQSGFLPIFQNCSYSATSATNRTLSCTQPIFDAVTSGITTIRFYLPSGTFTSSTGSCTRQNSNRRCYCTGDGSCNGATTFSCNTTSCSAVGTEAIGDIRVRDGKLTFTTGGCFINTPIAQNGLGCPISNTNTSRVTCNSANGTATSYSNTNIALDSFLPDWFKINRWQNYVYYQMTRPASATLSVGTRSAEAVVVTMGRSIDATPFALSKGAAQIRPSCNTLNNYLDSVENTDGDTVYDATSTQRSPSYNDQTFTVAP